jgi:hypothetical protein
MPETAYDRPDIRPLRIDLQQSWEADYWTRKLGVSLEELSKAVESAGDGAQAVADYLAENGAPATTE